MDRSTAIVLLLGGAFCVVVLGKLGHTLWTIRQNVRVTSWPTATAQFSTMRVVEKPQDESTLYQLEVVYAYEVDGTPYRGSRVAFGYASSTNRDAHDEIYQRLYEAQEVAVHYDPADPSTSALSGGIHRALRIELAFMFCTFVFGFAMTLGFWMASLPDTTLLQNLVVK